MAIKHSDREQIGDVLIRYATGIDSRDWDLFRTCFTADVHADYGDIGEWHGVDALTEYMAAVHEPMASTKHMMSNVAIDLNDDYLDLPFRIDQAGTGGGLTFSAWVRPDQVQGGVDNERMIFSTDNGGWDWSLAFRYGSLTTWDGTTRIESLLQSYPGKWYHVVAVFDPVQWQDKLLVDGGIADNLPVQVARDMGADVVIAVDVGIRARTGRIIGAIRRIGIGHRVRRAAGKQRHHQCGYNEFVVKHRIVLCEVYSGQIGIN